jgi:hypothetical protein
VGLLPSLPETSKEVDVSCPKFIIDFLNLYEKQWISSMVFSLKFSYLTIIEKESSRRKKKKKKKRKKKKKKK